MAYCSSCGSEVQGNFCAKCGSPVAAAPPPPGPPPPPPNYGSSAAAPPQASGLDENVACALCYLLGVLTGVLFLVLEPYNRNRNIRFHAFQSIFVWLGSIVTGIVISIVGSAIAFLPFVGWLIYLILWFGFGLGVLTLWVMLMYKAYNRERWVLPIIGPLAEKQA